MNLDNLYKLIDAGFTKNDLMRLMGNNAPAPAPATAPATAPAQDENSALLVQTMKQMQETLASIQAANLSNSNNQPPRDNDSIVNDYLAAIINPPQSTK